MSELADINARIDRLTRQLRNDPIKIIAPWPKRFSPTWQRMSFNDPHMQDGPCDSVFELWSICLREASRCGPQGPWTGGPVHGVWSYDVCDLGSLYDILSHAGAVVSDRDFEQIDDDIKMFARKIQLPIIERLT